MTEPATAAPWVCRCVARRELAPECQDGRCRALRQATATAARRSVIGSALRSYKAETEQYLLTYKSWPLTSPYDPACCDTCRREHARWETGEVSRKLLAERLDAITDALSEVLADV